MFLLWNQYHYHQLQEMYLTVDQYVRLNVKQYLRFDIYDFLVTECQSAPKM
ncbi:unnamed protein product [Schistosoma mattheei]|uniref:Uncharacterized protein n=1 Tax=Schistosoma mattheei TaxID=31246 RepID=A0A183PM72_9TREM|nr:unnamed protein product [Schistosoma mattheei]